MREPGLVRRCLGAYWADEHGDETLESQRRMAVALGVAADWLLEQCPAVELHPTFHRAFKEAARRIRAEAAGEA